MNPLVSVIMPAYNAERYILKSVMSILNQTYKNLELIVYDDGSTDSTIQILRSINDDRLVVYENDINRGIVHALNQLVKLSKGFFIARMDADDISCNNRLESQIKFLTDNKFDIVSSVVIKRSSNYSRYYPIKMNSDEVNYALKYFNPIVHPAVLGLSEIFKNNPYDEKFKWAEDYKLWCDLSVAGFKMGIQKDVLLEYRIHSNQVSIIRNKIQFELDLRIKKEYCSSYNRNVRISFKVWFFCAIKRVHFFLKFYKCLI